jgi:hypothetical protein
VVVEFYSSSVSKELKGEEETGWRRFSGGSEGSMTVLRFGSSRAKESGSRWRTTRRHGWRRGDADGSKSWEPIGLERLLRLERCRGKQRNWFGPGKRF